jgi:hypothetical protein
MVRAAVMKCIVTKVGYFLVALIWNIAVLSVVCFLASWLLDVFGYAIDSEIIRGYAYGSALLATIAMFWFSLLAAILSGFFKCKACDSRVMALRFPYFVSLTKCRCSKCKQPFVGISETNA